MAFQMHDLCGFYRKRFVRQFWRHLLVLSFLTSPGPGQLGSITLRINRTRAIYGIGLIILYACARVTRAGSGDKDRDYSYHRLVLIYRPLQYDYLFPISHPHPFHNFQILFIIVY